MSHIFTASCTAYGWRDTFPIEAKIGDTVILTVGYLKGSPTRRILFQVEYDTNGKREEFIAGDNSWVTTITYFRGQC